MVLGPQGTAPVKQDSSRAEGDRPIFAAAKLFSWGVVVPAAIIGTVPRFARKTSRSVYRASRGKGMSAAMRFQPGWLGLADELTMC